MVTGELCQWEVEVAAHSSERWASANKDQLQLRKADDTTYRCYHKMDDKIGDVSGLLVAKIQSGAAQQIKVAHDYDR